MQTLDSDEQVRGILKYVLLKDTKCKCLQNIIKFKKK